MSQIGNKSKNTAIACVYSKSKDFSIDYVKVFANIFKDLGFPLICFTDYEGGGFPSNVERIPLKYSWGKGWWAKMELFRPDVHPYNLFFTDLDNIFLSPATLKKDFIDRLENDYSDRPLMIKDLDHSQKRLQSAIMWIPHSTKGIVWQPFIKAPEDAINASGIYGDAKIIRKYLINGETCDTFQDVFGEDKIISFHLHWRRMDPRKRNNLHPMVMCFHGAGRKPMNYPNDGIVIQHFSKYLK